MAVNSQSEKSHVQILHYTSDDKHSIVLSHISCKAILNVKLYDFCERPAGKQTNGRMSFRRSKQMFKYMVFVNDLWLFTGKFKATLPHPIWIEHLAKRVMFCLFFFRFANAPKPPPPLPLRREWWKFAHERLQPLKNFWFRLCYCSTAFFSQHTARNINYSHKQQIA